MLEPALPLLELEPELLLELDELLELGELGPPDPLEAGEEAPELEGEEGGDGTEGVVGVLAEGQPINVNNTPTNAPVANQRKSLDGCTCMKNRVFMGCIQPSLMNLSDSDQKTTPSYQSPRAYRPEIAVGSAFYAFFSASGPYWGHS